MSEYAVTGSDAGKGSLLAALAEAAFLIGLEKNRFLILKTMLTCDVPHWLERRTKHHL